MTLRQPNLRESVEIVAAATPPAFPELIKHLDPVWIDEALLNTGTMTLRRRRLPADRVIWLVLGMAVLRDLSIPEVARQLELALPGSDGSLTVAPSALAQARARLGPDPMEWLFARTGSQWAGTCADADRWRGLALYGVDGTTLRVADSDENRAFFGSQSAGAGRGVSGYPLVRLVVLMALRSHVLAAAEFGPYRDERIYASPLWSAVPDHSLVVVDRLYLQASILVPLTTTGHNRHWLTRAKSTTKYKVLQRLGIGDDLVEITVSDKARRQDPTLPPTFRARAIRYQRKGHAPQVLLTSLLDPKQYPADELRSVYHVRWELELGFGEIKTDLLERLETIRSKSPATVEQELWGILIAYNLIRLEMARIADDLGVEPTQISFVAAVSHFVEQWLWATNTLTPAAIPKRLDTMRDRMRRFVLPPRRPERVFPRAVKIKMSNYARKRPPPKRRRK
ncbi:MAG TPA: IS4 family transposase [Kofleriaceae bacterium]|nr:IS4 family transposase [Kofleriaceae bacterium]